MAQSQTALVETILSDIQMTVKRMRSAYAGEHARWLDHAAKLLCKVTDATVRVELFLKIVLRTLKLLARVDDSNAALQSVLWSGSYCSDIWRKICVESDEATLKLILEKVLAADEDMLTSSLFFPRESLPLSEATQRNLVDFLVNDFAKKHRNMRMIIITECLTWLAYVKDEETFNALCKRHRLTQSSVWESRFLLALNLERYDEALSLAETNNSKFPKYVNELRLRIFEKSQNRELLLETAVRMAKESVTLEEYKRLKPLLTEEEHTQFVHAMLEAATEREGLNVSFCEILFTIGELKLLRDYLVARYDEIHSLYRCTGMIPLGKKLFKTGEALSALILIRGAIYYLMSRGNSKYYDDVHRYYALLNEVSRHVTVWETIPVKEVFDAQFAKDFSTRRTFWD